MAKNTTEPKYRVIRGEAYASVPDSQLNAKAILTGLRETSTSHGFPQIYNAPGQIKRGVWFFILLGMVGALIYNLEKITSKFFKYDVEASVYIHNVNKQQFPAVTLCNMSPFKASLVAENAQIAAILGVNKDSVRRKREARVERKVLVEEAKRKRRDVARSRVKRYETTPACNSNNYDPMTGICYGIAIKTWGSTTSVRPDPWASQRSNCEVYGWDLASINTIDKMNYIKSKPGIFTPQPNEHTIRRYWILLKYVNGVWRWGPDNTDPEVTYTAWDTGYPVDEATNECVYGDPDNDHKWRNELCFTYLIGLCERDTGLVPSTNQETSITTAVSTTQVVTTEAPTTTDQETTALLKTTAPPTTTNPPVITTFAATTEPASTTLGNPTTLAETTEPPTTTIQNPTTTAEITEPPTTTLRNPTTKAETTEPPTTTLRNPTTKAETTEPPTTTLRNPTTKAETTEPPTTTFQNPTSLAETTEPPTTTLQNPTTMADTTEPSTTTAQNPTTMAETTEPPTTTAQNPTTMAETTEPPTTTLHHPTTVAETTASPTATESVTSVVIDTTFAETTSKPSTTDAILTTIPVTTVPETSTYVKTTQGISTTLEMTTTNTEQTTEKLTTLAETTNKDFTTTDQEKISTQVETTIVEDTTSAMQTTDELPDTTLTDVDQSFTTSDTSGESHETEDVVSTTEKSSPSTVAGISSTLAGDEIASTTDQTSTFRNNVEQTTNIDETLSTLDMNQRTQSFTTTPRIPVITPQTTPELPERRPVPDSQFPERELQEEEFIDQTQTFEQLSNIDEDVKKSVGYEADKFIIDCQFAGYPCYPWHFSYFYNGVHGNCYIFNSGWNTSDPIRWSYHVGRRYALKVVLNIDQDEYVEKMGQEAGVRVVVHHQDKMPFPEDEGIMARPGLLTSIGIRQVAIERKGEPYTTCFRVDDSHVMRNVYEEKYRVKYTNLACYKTCYQRNVIELCGCADAGFPMTGKAFGDVNVNACNSSNIEEDDCLYNVSQFYATNKLKCDCADPCSEEYYSPRVSHSRWPADNHLQGFLASHEALIPNIINSSDSKKYEDDLAKVEVYFETFEYERIIEVASYKDLVFIGDVGGTFGLWVGWSFITVFEFVEMFADLIVQSCRKWWANRAEKKAKPSNKQRLPRRSLHYLRTKKRNRELEKIRKMNSLNVPSGNTTGLEGPRDSGISSACSVDTEATTDDRDVISRVSRDTMSGKSRITTRSRHGTNMFFQ